MIRPVSEGSLKALGKAEKMVIISRFPLDDYNCACQNQIRAHMRHLATLNGKSQTEWMEKNVPYQCPRAKNQHLYTLTCQHCGEIVAQVNAMNLSLKNWSNLHYISWYDKYGWKGTFGVNTNPYTGETRIECCCGENKSFKNYKIEGVS